MIKNEAATLKEAYQLGEKAFEKGLNSIPLLNVELMQLVKETSDNVVGTAIPIYKAFNKGYALTSLAHGRDQG